MKSHGEATKLKTNSHLYLILTGETKWQEKEVEPYCSDSKPEYEGSAASREKRKTILTLIVSGVVLAAANHRPGHRTFHKSVWKLSHCSAK